MKIVIATPLYPPDDGGPATRAKILEAELPKKGISVAVISFSAFRHLPKGVSHLRYLLALSRAANSADLIYALDTTSVGIPALVVSIWGRKPLVVSIVGDYAWEQGTQRAGVTEDLDMFVARNAWYGLRVWVWRKAERLVAAHARAIIVPSQYLKKIVGLWGRNEHDRKMIGAKTVVIYNAFNAQLPVESKETLRKELHILPHTVISAGRFVPWKGFFTLMDVMAEVRNVLPDAVLEIAGSGDRSAYEAYSKEKGYNFVTFLGVLPRDLLMKRIKAADCFALNTGYEGLSHVILETMALRTPVVTTDVGGNPELFTTHTRNWLAPYNNTSVLTAHIIRALSSDAGVEKDVSAAASFVSDMTEERMVRDTIGVLKRALSKSPHVSFEQP